MLSCSHFDYEQFDGILVKRYKVMADEQERKGQQEEAGQNPHDTLNSALNKSSRELQLLANFYHKHGYFKQAQDIYKTIVNIREQRDRQDDERSGDGKAKPE